MLSGKLTPMLDASAIAAGFRQLAPDQLRTALATFLPKDTTRANRKSRHREPPYGAQLGQSLRNTMARWIVNEIVPVERVGSGGLSSSGVRPCATP